MREGSPQKGMGEAVERWEQNDQKREKAEEREQLLVAALGCRAVYGLRPTTAVGPGVPFSVIMRLVRWFGERD